MFLPALNIDDSEPANLQNYFADQLEYALETKIKDLSEITLAIVNKCGCVYNINMIDLEPYENQCFHGNRFIYWK